MICPQCEAAGERSRVYPGRVDITLMNVSEYWDEDGNYVVDDPNTRTSPFFCSTGHRWVARTTRGETTIEVLPNDDPA